LEVCDGAHWAFVMKKGVEVRLREVEHQEVATFEAPTSTACPE